MKSDNLKSSPKKWGNSREQAIRRLEKFRPDLLEKVNNGELSHNKAMVVAGLRKPQAIIYVGSSKSAVKQIIKHFSGEQIDYIWRKLKEASYTNTD